MADEFVTVPFKTEKDGSKTIFLPDCQHKMGYEIGARYKDKEKGIQNYWEALEKLLKMDSPRFRRKNKEGHSGTVTCEPGDVVEVSRAFIESERIRHGG